MKKKTNGVLVRNGKRECLFCEEIISIYLPRNKYCCVKCRYADFRRKNKLKIKARFTKWVDARKRGEVPCINKCRVCGKGIPTYITKYCSPQCRHDGFYKNRKTLKGEDHPRWNGGKMEVRERANERRKLLCRTDPEYKAKRDLINKRSSVKFQKAHPGRSKENANRWYKNNAIHARAVASLGYKGLRLTDNINNKEYIDMLNAKKVEKIINTILRNNEDFIKAKIDYSKAKSKIHKDTYMDEWWKKNPHKKKQYNENRRMKYERVEKV